MAQEVSNIPRNTDHLFIYSINQYLFTNQLLGTKNVTQYQKYTDKET